jgi:superfamily II DNA or RNA helicase
MKQVTLKPSQVDHFEKLKGILERSFFAFDLSMLGTGKTYIGLKMFETLGLKHLVVIAPVSVLNKWDGLTDGEYLGVSYATFRSTSKSNKLLKFETHPEIPRCCFEPTDYTKRLAEQGVLLVIDESQNLKNNTLQNIAVKVFIKELKRYPQNKVLFLSGSPFDKKEHALNYITLLGLTGGLPLTIYDKSTRMYDPEGFYKLIDNLKSINRKDTEKHIADIIPEVSNIRVLTLKVYDLFIDVIKKHNSSSMKEIVTELVITKQNSHYIEPEITVTQTIDQHLETIGSALAEWDYNQNRQLLKSFITTALVGIENCKLNIFVRLIISTLKNTNNKIVIGLNYTWSQVILRQLLEYFNVKSSLLNGSVTKANRKETIDLFNRNDDILRVLICNIEVISTGIDLDDKHGDRPRTVYLSPNYSTIAQYQVSHRVLRLDTRSNSTINMVVVKDHSEISMLNTLSKKSEIMKSTMVTDNIIEFFPGHYVDNFDTTLELVTFPKYYDLTLLMMYKEIGTFYITNTKKMWATQRCVQCELEIQPGEAVKIVRCDKTVFHQRCLDDWLRLETPNVFVNVGPIVVPSDICVLCLDDKKQLLLEFSKYADTLNQILKSRVVKNVNNVDYMKKIVGDPVEQDAKRRIVQLHRDLKKIDTERIGKRTKPQASQASTSQPSQPSQPSTSQASQQSSVQERRDKLISKFEEWIQKVEYPALKKLLLDNIDNIEFWRRQPEEGSTEDEQLAIGYLRHFYKRLKDIK